MDRVGVGDSSMSCKIPLILSSFDTDLMEYKMLSGWSKKRFQVMKF